MNRRIKMVDCKFIIFNILDMKNYIIFIKTLSDDFAVENENHCDFVKLREMLIRTNMEDLRASTHHIHYELYRRCKLQEMGFSDNESMR